MGNRTTGEELSARGEPQVLSPAPGLSLPFILDNPWLQMARAPGTDTPQGRTLSRDCKFKLSHAYSSGSVSPLDPDPLVSSPVATGKVAEDGEGPDRSPSPGTCCSPSFSMLSWVG